jgi:hypothetical protein
MKGSIDDGMMIVADTLSAAGLRMDSLDDCQKISTVLKYPQHTEVAAIKMAAKRLNLKVRKYSVADRARAFLS